MCNFSYGVYAKGLAQGKAENEEKVRAERERADRAEELVIGEKERVIREKERADKAEAENARLRQRLASLGDSGFVC